MLVAHRGGSKIAPENTMVAFRRAVEWWGADMLELDVRLTRDGHVVVIHDETLDRTTDGEGPVAARTLDEIRDLDAGYRFEGPDGGLSFRGTGVVVPTFEEVLAAFPDTRINVESKESRAAAPLVEVIRRHRAEHRVLVAAEVEGSRKGARGYVGPWGASRYQVLWFWALHRLPGSGPYLPRADVFQVPELWKGMRIVSQAFVRAAHRRNIPVQVWTVDDAESMKRLLAWGVDGIQSDRLDVLARVLTEVTGRPPPPGPADVPTPGASA
jgi:glycerophosphoryl diester phosphodiesterase